MEERESIGSFVFESRETYDRAAKETEFIQKIREKADISNPKTALKVYNKSVADKLFDTVIGYNFLYELRKYIIDSGLATDKTLAEIPVKEMPGQQPDTMPERPAHEGRFQRLYEGQRLLNKKMKIVLAALVILLAGFIVINFKLEYSIFTYFTDYKTNMEEELIDKYEKWEQELITREKALDKSESGDGQTGSGGAVQEQE